MNFKKLISLILCAAFFLSVFPVQAVLATEPDVEALFAESVNIYEGDRCWYEDVDGEMVPIYDMSPKSVTVYYDDGSEKTVEYERFFDEFGEWPDLRSNEVDQHDTPWGTGRHKMRLDYGGASCNYFITISESPVDRIEATDFSIIEDTSMYTKHEWDNDAQIDRTYPAYGYEVPVTVYFKDGTSAEADGNGNIQIGDEWYHVMSLDDQRYNNSWGTGPHEVFVWLLGATCTVNVDIVESRVMSIRAEVSDTIYRGNGHIERRWDDDLQQDVDFYHQDYYVKAFVEMDDGETYEIDRDFEYGGATYRLEINDDQGPGNEWTVGRHRITVSVGGVSCRPWVNVVESPVDHITADPIVIVEGSNTRTDREWVEDDQQDYEYTRYDYRYKAKVYLADGTVLETDDNMNVQIAGEWYRVDSRDDQGYGREWGEGVHSATLSILGAECELAITIVPSRVVSITAEASDSIYRGDCHTERRWDEGLQRDVEFVNQDYYAKAYVTMDDGETYEVDGDFVYDGVTYNFERWDDQYYENEWGVGAHDCNVRIGDKSCVATVNVVASPIDYIEADPIVIVEGAGARTDHEWHEDDHQDYEYTRYDYFYKVKVHLTDGTVLESDENICVKIGNDWYHVDCHDDQGYGREWSEGSYTATLSILGAECQLAITIVPSRVVSVRAEASDSIYMGDCHTERRWDEGLQRDVEFRMQDYYVTAYATMDDGETYEVVGDFVYDGVTYNFERWDDQYYENEWGVGAHDCNVRIGDKSCVATVNVVASPIDYIEADPIVIVAGSNTRTDREWNEDEHRDYEYTRYDYRYKVKVHLTDGTVLESDDNMNVQIGGDWYRVESHDDQGYGREWSEGSHTATLSILGAECQLAITIVPSRVVSVRAEARDSIYREEGRTEWWWSDTLQRDAEFFNQGYYVKAFVTMDDGVEYEVDGDFVYDGVTYMFERWDDQSPDNEWEVGPHTCTVRIGDKTCTAEFNVIASPVDYITAEDIVIVEGASRFTEFAWDDENHVSREFMKYYYSPDITIHLKDGTEIHTGNSNVVNIGGAWYNVDWEDGQNFNNEWGRGDHTVTVRCLGVDATFTVTIVEGHVASITATAEDSLYLGDCHTERRWYNELDRDVEFRMQDYYVKAYVTMDDGESFYVDGDFDYDGVHYQFERWDDQEYNNEWEAGVHACNVRVGGASCVIPVNVIDSPVDYIEGADIVIPEGAFVRLDCEWNEDLHKDVDYLRYDYTPHVTIHLKDGTVLKSDDDWGVDIGGRRYYISAHDSQGYGNEWGRGDHTVTLGFLGAECDITVTVVQSRVQSLRVEIDDSIYTVDGHMESRWVDEEDRDVEFFHQDYYVKAYVTMDNGETIETDDDFEFDGVTYSIERTDSQWPGREWQVGEHEAVISVGGVSVETTVNVVPIPIERIEGSDVVIVAGAGMHPAHDWERDVDYMRYDYNPAVTVYYTDGTVRTYYDRSVEVAGKQYFVATIDDQSSESEWELGPHTATLNVLGFTCEITVTLAESRVVSVSADNRHLLQYADMRLVNEYDPESDRDVEYFRYMYRTGVTVTMDDGKVLIVNDTFDYDGATYYLEFSDDQNYKDGPWDVGHHTATVTVGGMTAEFDVEVEETPIDHIELDEPVLQMGVDGHNEFIPETGEVYFYFDYMPSGTIVFKDGTSERFSGYRFNARGYDLDVEAWDEQEEEHWYVGGGHEYHVVVAGFYYDVPATVVDKSAESLEVWVDGLDVYLKITNEDGTSETYLYDWFEEYFHATAGSYWLQLGVLHTDKRDFSCEVGYRESECGVIKYDTDVTFVLGTLRGNSVDTCLPVRLYTTMDKMSLILANYKKFNSSFTHIDADDYNADDVVTIAVNACVDIDEFGEIDETPGAAYVTVSRATAEEAVAYFFGIENVDVTACTGYDQESDSVRVAYYDNESPRYGAIGYETSKGCFMFMPHMDLDYDWIEFVTNDDGVVLSVTVVTEPEVEKFTVTCDGVVIGEYEAGEIVDLPVPEGIADGTYFYRFFTWEGESVTRSSYNAGNGTSNGRTYKMEMPDHDVELTSKYIHVANTDGASGITAGDLATMKLVLVNGLNYSEEVLEATDINGDGALNAHDVQAIKEYLVGAFIVNK